VLEALNAVTTPSREGFQTDQANSLQPVLDLLESTDYSTRNHNLT